MAIKLYCRVCGAFIKDVSPDKVSTVTGQELCIICADNIKKIHEEVEKFKKDTVVKVNEIWDKAREELKQVETFRQRMIHRCEALFNQKSAEADTIIQNLLEGKKKKEAPKKEKEESE